ncbi:bifunctional diaminohydroxyphosphoribosylaminopyrimidine deaminase/5-amino-6-(5-phosphoribosylamino)uracil reductase RibD [Kutzneria sp. 744]|uniref:bifunctional diaminohydroxyphosphoribosylaminopyrimidine deaminase/5-amino-6-(5-phosphoribosylamino)uracil reductase RibD n=1 Tax=Kutzneria sp. (strain 744) TaxID=345341 RepID=UPI0003EEAD04|nr:bifunctional diaminohydroxyphosphoribosylaminopyrimidine deaminase/5-amino-6-(5-phosphoribosylamino)uracil reductase RibD [Kutzneria sp. 744]EWM15260.1 riboflavin biosynthesis protein RibD [Kutzneria sp. 744]
MTTSEFELDAMRRAISLSAFGLGSASPNPPVGCVILDRDGQPVGEGFHERKGEPHAEVNALAAAGERARGGTAVVTLEPCNHFGRTPPCHQALIDAGVVRVLIAVIDPTSRGVGGVARMREAGVEVEVGVLAEEAEVVLRPWLGALHNRRPRVTWVCEVGAAGPTAIRRQQFDVLALCAGADAVLDDGGKLKEGRPGRHSADVFSLSDEVGDDPVQALRALYEAGVRTLLLDGGPDLAVQFVGGGVLDEIRLYVGETAPSGAPPTSGPLLPGGFRIRSISRVAEGIVVVATIP